MDKPTVALHPAVLELAAAFKLVEGRISLPDADAKRARATLSKVSAVEERKLVLQSLVLLATRFRAQDEKASAEAVEQLTGLAAELVGGAEQARKLFTH